ncbi:LOW QUALITY PROTEIN: transcription elongation factor A protein-like 7 [Phyllostomus discolor]|uniref:LOW QUALITY PROTEIN: transcription elongation factor A protein-like 7 n=1 Tax=Phyllostomus discolor TaxID=89673 RepID=A0A6J2LJZ8_9CHIR|nr:LOW QUALITY PROTEIN: transcription elongation factor A protein-like 7 [Phyllostomus discolor]
MDMNIGVGIDCGKGSLGVLQGSRFTDISRHKKEKETIPNCHRKQLHHAKKLCKENEGKPKFSVPKREEEPPHGKFERQQTEGNFRQRLLKSLEEFKEDIDYRPFNNEEMTREGDEMKQSLEEIRGLRKKFRAPHFNNRHSRDCPYPVQCLSHPNLIVFCY